MIIILYAGKQKYVEFIDDFFFLKQDNFGICLDNILFINQYINNFH